MSEQFGVFRAGETEILRRLADPELLDGTKCGRFKLFRPNLPASGHIGFVTMGESADSQLSPQILPDWESSRRFSGPNYSDLFQNGKIWPKSLNLPAFALFAPEDLGSRQRVTI